MAITAAWNAARSASKGTYERNIGSIRGDVFTINKWNGVMTLDLLLVTWIVVLVVLVLAAWMYQVAWNEAYQ